MSGWLESVITGLVCAEGLHVLASAQKVSILIKRRDQRTEGETKRVQYGLFREFALELLVLVPISVALGFLILRPALQHVSWLQNINVDALVGFISYGFPYAALKRKILDGAVRFLKEEAAKIADKDFIKDTQDMVREDAERQ
jgi:hypothetical protein